MTDRSPDESGAPRRSPAATESNAGGDSEESGGLSPIAWIAIGCGTILILTAVLLAVGGYFVYDTARDALREFEDDPTLAAATAIVRMNPDLEIVETDAEGRTITIRDTTTGEEVTFDLEAVAEGRIDFETAEGEGRIRVDEDEERPAVEIETDDGAARFGGDAADLPDWVPLYPGGESRPGFTGRGDRGEAGMVQIVTEDAVEDVVDYYREALEAGGFTIEQEGTTRGATTTGSLIASSADPERSIQLTAVGIDQGTRIVLIYRESAGRDR